LIWIISACISGGTCSSPYLVTLRTSFYYFFFLPRSFYEAIGTLCLFFPRFDSLSSAAFSFFSYLELILVPFFCLDQKRFSRFPFFPLFSYVFLIFFLFLIPPLERDPLFPPTGFLDSLSFFFDLFNRSFPNRRTFSNSPGARSSLFFCLLFRLDFLVIVPFF